MADETKVMGQTKLQRPQLMHRVVYSRTTSTSVKLPPPVFRTGA